MIKALAIVLAACATLAASAFDSEGWLEKRAFLDREAERLEAEYRVASTNITEAAEGLAIPIENFASGAVKTMITASRAQYFFEKKLVWGEGVKIEQFKEDGTTLATVTAASCLVDQETKSGWAEGAAKVTYAGTTVEGEGVYFSAAEEYLRITEKTKIVSKELKFGGFKL